MLSRHRRSDHVWDRKLEHEDSHGDSEHAVGEASRCAGDILDAQRSSASPVELAMLRSPRSILCWNRLRHSALPGAFYGICQSNALQERGDLLTATVAIRARLAAVS